ncbi:MAG: ribonuclease P protein subunit [Candidatus Altiarchaeota archaeon]|nr:ribonuclease P protein subunit [Candidatus Altiarchaeota archaeon]
MTITPLNILRHELIGLRAKVVGSKYQGCRCEGGIVDETLNTITLKTRDGEKKIPKKDSLFEFTLPSEAKVRVEGGLLLSRSEDRTKKKHRIRFA